MSRAVLLGALGLVALLAATFALALGLARRGGEPARALAAADAGRGEAATASRPAATPARRSGRELFGHTCGSCHALADAGASGRFGPDLDERRPSARRVRRAIRTGSLDGIMQPGLYTGRDARAVAAYVARVAGKPTRR